MTSELEKTEMLCTLVYLNFIVPGRLSETLPGIIAAQKEWPSRMTKEEWQKVTDRVQKYLSHMIVIQIEESEGHRAVLFEEGRHGYVIFRGTGNDEEWEDNALGMVEADTKRQKMAANFVRRVYKRFHHMTVAGHSKGGNKAQYAAITLPKECVDRCYSFDGQGFSVAFFEKYKQKIEQRKPIIHLVSERRGFVHALGLMVKETVYYTGRRGEARKGHHHGDPLPYFHCPDALRASDGQLGPQSGTPGTIEATIPLIVNRLMVHFLQTPKYKPYWKQTAYGLVTIMTQKKEPREETITAIARLLIVFAELAAIDKTFSKQAAHMLHLEHNVFMASANADLINKISHKFHQLMSH